MAEDTTLTQNEASGRRTSSPTSNLRGGDKPAKKELRAGSPVCQCADCEEYFGGIGAFDMHLIGMGSPKAPRCRTPRQMEAAGLHTNANGVWIQGFGKKKT